MSRMRETQRTCGKRRMRGSGVRFSKRMLCKPHDACRSGRCKNPMFLRVGSNGMLLEADASAAIGCFSKPMLQEPDVLSVGRDGMLAEADTHGKWMPGSITDASQQRMLGNRMMLAEADAL